MVNFVSGAWFAVFEVVDHHSLKWCDVTSAPNDSEDGELNKRLSFLSVVAVSVPEDQRSLQHKAASIVFDTDRYSAFNDFKDN